MKSYEEIKRIVDACEFPGWSLHVGQDGERHYFQVICATGTCAVTGQPYNWRGRKWFLSPHMTDSEVVQTVFKAVLTASEHEVREAFKYRGQAIFGPHISVEMLVGLSRRSQPDAREPVA